jgi:hypothetical protein
VLVIYPEGGFGHTIHGPDLARRLFPDKRVTVLFQRQSATHNPLVSQIRQDITLIFLPIEFAVGKHPNLRRVPAFVSLRRLWLVKPMKLLFPNKIVLSDDDLLRIVCRHSEQAREIAANTDWLIGYYE